MRLVLKHVLEAVCNDWFENVYTATFSDEAQGTEGNAVRLDDRVTSTIGCKASLWGEPLLSQFRDEFLLVGHQRQVAPHWLPSLHICFRRSLLMHNMELSCPPASTQRCMEFRTARDGLHDLLGPSCHQFLQSRQQFHFFPRPLAIGYRQ